MSEDDSIKTIHKTDFLGTEKLFPLLLKMGIPAAIGMLVNALYNVIDTVFVGRGVGPLAIAALSIVFPIQMIVASVAMGIGVGAASIVSRRLGEKRTDLAAHAIGTSYSAMTVGTVILVILLLVFMEPILRFFGSTETILPYASEYAFSVSLGFFFFALSMLASSLFRAEGNARASMVGMMIGAGLNCLLDPLFIFVFHMGIRGAAYATVISQFVSCVYYLVMYLGKKNSIMLTGRHFLIHRSILSESLVLGIPSFVQEAGMSLLAIILNNTIGALGGDEAIINYGMASKLLSLLILPMLGLIQGFQPIAGYNYGAGNFKRVKQSLGLTIITAIGSIIVWYGLIMLFPAFFVGLFTTDPKILVSGAGVLRILICCLPIAAVQITGSTYFQAAGKARQSLLLGVSRQFLALIPLLLILPGIWGLSGVWIAFPLSDLSTSVITAVILFRELRHLSRNSSLPDGVLSPEAMPV